MAEETKEISNLSSAFRETGGIPLSEGSFTIDQTKLFVPFDQGSDILNERTRGSLLVEIQPFVLITKSDVLLFDTGLGFNDTKGGTMQVYANLEKNGIRPEQVTKVLMSHLHKDHAGAVSLESDHSKLSFPNATYFIQKREFDFAMENGMPSFIPSELEALRNSQQVHWIHDDEGMIGNNITYKLTGAHSPFHQVFCVKENKETYFFGGDDAPQLQQMKVRYKTKYDFNPDKAMQLRQEWWKKGSEKSWSFLFYHDIKTPVYKKN